jgi:inosine triphosphate pyrophosphatase
VELAALNGFPGPMMKFAEQTMGPTALYELTKGHNNKRATVHCVLGYFDGKEKIIVDGVIHGKIVEPRGKNGFGFDYCFMLDGQAKTNAEMTPEEKNRTSHRYKAIRKLLKELIY